MVVLRTAETEAELVDQAKNGDRSAFGDLVRQHYDGVVNVVYRMCDDASLAEDVAQETFLRAWINIQSIHPHLSLRNWLFRIGINATLDMLRRRTEKPVDDEIVEMVVDQTPDPETALIVKEQAALIQKAMRSLPDAARGVLILREYGDLSYEEISAVLEIPIGTVMSRLNYARNRLREMLKAKVDQLEYEYA